MKKLVGDRKFYLLVLTVAIPIMVQNGITNFVGLLDNIMVGKVGTDQMSGVAIVNQLIFVFNLGIFGAISGIGIFTAQFCGQKNNRGIRDTFRFKITVCSLISIFAIIVLNLFGEPLIMMFIHSSSSSSGADAVSTCAYAMDYLKVIVWGLVPFAVTQVYSGTLRECKQTVTPMKAGIAAVLVNLVFNYLLIYGKFGFPQMGVMGAALATVLSRFVEAGVVAVWTHAHKRANVFIIGAYGSLKVPANLVKNIAIKGTPLMLNEVLWSLGMTLLTQLYSMRGLEVISAISISNTLANLFSVVFIALGSSVGIIIGNLLGAGEYEKAKDYDTKLIAFSVATCFIIGAIMAFTADMFPGIYNTSAEVKRLASGFIIVHACLMPLNGFVHAAYFTLRCGGKTLVTFLFDSVFCWCLVVPSVYLMITFTDWGITKVLALGQSLEFVKCIIGYVLIKKGVWINNILDEGSVKKLKQAQNI